MKKIVLTLPTIAVLAIACNKNPNITDSKNTNTSSTVASNIQTEVYEGIAKEKNEDTQEKLVLYREKGSKSGKFDFTSIGKASKTEFYKYSGTFTEVKAVTEDGRVLGDVAYRLSTPTAELPSYYTIKDGKLLDIGADMIAPAGN